MINKLVIIGVGLIGGSLARAVKRAGFCKTIVGNDRNLASLEKAADLSVIDHYEQDLAAAVKGADIVVIAVPMGTMESVLEALANCVEANTIITDVGSAKASVVASARRHLSGKFANFVPGHPIAGTEHSGVEASFAELYNDRRVVLTPVNETSPSALALVKQMWQAAGGIVEVMPVVQHDEVLAATSHLPHLLAYNLMNVLVALDSSEEIFRFSAGGFRDFTRIAASNPNMWRDICLTNREGILGVLDRYVEELAKLRQAIDQSDGNYLLEAFARGKAARDRHFVK